MTQEIRLSAVIPAHNAEPFLSEAIDSVLRQGPDIDLIVVNDGSTDGTAAIIRSYGSRIRSVAQEQRGLGAARNRGIAASAGEWIAFLDADDIWSPDKTRLQFAAIDEQPGLDMVFGQCVEFSADEARWPARTDPFPGMSASAMLARRTLFERTGGFEESGRVGEFLDWYSRALLADARVAAVDQIVFRRRVHGANMTRLRGAKHDEYLGVMRAHLRRRRDTDGQGGS